MSPKFLILLSMLFACEEAELRNNTRPSSEDSDLPGYEAETTDFIAAGEAKKIAIGTTTITIDTDSTTEDAELRMRKLSSAPVREATASFGEAVGDVIEIKFYSPSQQEILDPDFLNASYTLKQAVAGISDEQNLKIVAILNAGSETEKISILSSRAIEVEEAAGLVSFELQISVKLKLTDAIVYAVESEHVSSTIKISDFSEDLGNDSGSTITSDDNLPEESDIELNLRRKFVLGIGSSCHINDSNALKCWGENDKGQLGAGNTQAVGRDPSIIDNGMDEIAFAAGLELDAISVGYKFACGLFLDKTVRCWGDNRAQLLGTGNSTPSSLGDSAALADLSLTAVNLGVDFIPERIYSGMNFTCVESNLQKIKCFGGCDKGSCGYDSEIGSNHKFGADLPSIDLPDNFAVKTFGLGDGFACALSKAGEVRCWGSNADLRLGRKIVYDPMETSPFDSSSGSAAIDFGDGQKVVKLSVGLAHSCVIFDKRGVKCWGSNSRGALGINQSSVDQNTGFPLELLPANTPEVNFGWDTEDEFPVDIATGGHHSCILSSKNRIICWGRNTHGQFGVNSTDDCGNEINQVPSCLQPVNTNSLVPIYIFVNNTQTCFVTAENKFYCWGQNVNGEIGIGSSQPNIGDEADEIPAMLKPVSF